MKIKDFKAKLDRLDPEMEVVLCCEDEHMRQEGNLFLLFDIQSIDVTEAEKIRLEDGKPYLKLGKSDRSDKLAVVDITTDF
ncbi:MAG: hypothetical protein KKA05_02940 [Alphaproteobacteria bacterium]|nr:hypothetical protein [Alphaproteobacteria bacterium]MBU0859734.1 hypothetical protein [Alphaproteobacteria bacterium]